MNGGTASPVEEVGVRGVPGPGWKVELAKSMLSFFLRPWPNEKEETAVAGKAACKHRAVERALNHCAYLTTEAHHPTRASINATLLPCSDLGVPLPPFATRSHTPCARLRA